MANKTDREYPDVDLSLLSENERVKEVYAHFGLALYSSNVLEHSIVNALIVLILFPKRANIKSLNEWEKKHDAYYKKCFQKTFGGLTTNLIQKGSFTKDVVVKLKKAREVRNVLAHRFFRERDQDFMNLEGKISMLAYCKNATLLFCDLNDQIDDQMKSERQKFGLSDKSFERAYKDYSEDARTGAYRVA